MGEFGGNLFFWEQKVIFRKQVVSSEKYENFSFLRLTTFLINFKVLNGLQHFWIMPSPIFIPNFPPHPTSIFLFRRNKDNVHFPFSSTACGVKPALQLRFSVKPDSAFALQLPFSTGSKHGRALCGTNKSLQPFLMRWTFQISPIIPPHGFWTEVAGRSPACFLVTFCTPQKVTEKSPLLLNFYRGEN